ncbi:MAG: molybdopterin cofactor-binding domain-containing protein [Jatrophihabitans sp.]|uniref:molybdopterin cofactor-binding domain-containing protein n=1 Tax=Jatrophihabitans sp. TaxID=1932789 RepID=UPI003F7D6793
MPVPAEEPPVTAVRPRPTPHPDPTEPASTGGTSRRSFLGFLVAAPTLVAAGGALLGGKEAGAAVPSLPEPSDLFDLGDLQNLAALPTSNLITVVVNPDGTVSFALPRAEVGQGIQTAIAMLIAEELSVPIERVDVTLADARPELVWNQLTGGSNSIRSMYTPVRVAAAAARERLAETAAAQWGVSPSSVTAANGVLTGPGGQRATYGSLASAAAVRTTISVQPTLKPISQFTVVGKPQNRLDARDIVTGRKLFTNDHQVPNALPTMICRPPTVNGTLTGVSNLAQVRQMPGVTHAEIISKGVAVRARTFGQCIDAIRALQCTWNLGPNAGKSDDTLRASLKQAELPVAAVQLPLTNVIDQRFTFAFASNSPLETGTAIADVRKDSAEIWSCMKVPIVAQNDIANMLGLPVSKVTCHVTQGGGSFGRHLFSDAALEAAEASQKFGVPVKLMWHRTDDFRQGRMHPIATSRVRAVYAGNNVLSFEQRHTSVSTDFGHGFGEMLTEYADKIPLANTLGYAQTIFELTANVPYNFGVTDQALSEIEEGNFHTGSLRNIYSPDVCTAIELVVDQLAAAMKMDPFTFRKNFLKDDRSRAVLQRAADLGQWGKAMAPGTAQGIAFHAEYKAVVACVVEIDCTSATVNRQIRDARTGPRVTRATFVVDPGLCINPTGLKAQMLGGIMDGIAHALTTSMHLKDGTFLEGSWDNYFYTRQWNVPPQIDIEIMPTTTGQPSGAGELGVAASKAAVACAYARATGTVPTTFPISHTDPNLGFDPLPTTPPIPQSPTNGLEYER